MAPDDFDPLWLVFREIIDDGTTYVQDERTTKDEFADYWTGRRGEQWVAYEDERVLGGYTLRPNHVGRGSHVATASYIVAASARGRGIGAQLGEHSIERARALGFRGVQFNFVVSTNAPALLLWQRLGFAIVGSLPRAFRHPTRGWVDAHIMFRPLIPFGEQHARE
jgi:L-amino acid N-acyltransferase YncA